MSASNITESDTLDWVLGGVDPAWRAGATGYFALVTGVSVDEADPMANECTYTPYVRVPGTTAIANAVLAALNATTIPVNVKKMNGATLVGDGTSGNKWRG